MSTHEVSWSPYVCPKYKSYNKRLSAFFERFWPVSFNQDDFKMAESRFFYSELGDIVVCAFCGLSLNKWLPNDIFNGRIGNAEKEHLKSGSK